MKPQVKPARNRIGRHKLTLSKWTAVTPENREKHFLVTKVFERDAENRQYCVLESVLSRSEYKIERRELTDAGRWLTGWR